MTTYSAKSAAIRAAKGALGGDAVAGCDFKVEESGGRWSWAPLNAKAGEVAPPLFAAEADGKGGALVTPKEPKPAKKPKEKKPEPARVPSESRTFPEASAEGAATRMSAKHKAALEAAQKGTLPSEPDFSAETHKRWRPKLAEVVALAKAGDVEGLRAYDIKPISTSPKAIDRFRNLAVVALEARAQ